MDFYCPIESPPRTLNIEQQAEFFCDILRKFVFNSHEYQLPKFPSILRRKLRERNEVKNNIIKILDECYKAKEQLNKVLHFKDKDFVILNSFTRLIHKPDIIKKILKYYTDNNIEDIKDFDLQHNTYKTFKGKNKKITKLSWDIPNLGNFEKEKAKYGESITPTTIYVTTNPLEILLQGVNSSWSSCNNFLHSHWGECVSHALSQTAFIAFITSDKFAGEVFVPKKTGRSWLYYEELEKSKRIILAGGGTYQCGEPTDSYGTAALRQNIVLEVLKHLKPEKDMFPTLLDVKAGSPGFWDIAHPSNTRRLILASSNYKQTVKHWLSVSKGVGSSVPCIFCDGNKTRNSQGICDLHLKGNGIFYCDVCDKEIPRGQLREANNNFYCKECYDKSFYQCHICGNTHHKDDRIILHAYKDAKHITVNICPNCTNTQIMIRCSKCNKYLHILYPYFENKEGNILCIECHDTSKTSS